MSNKRVNYAKQYDQKEKLIEQPAEVVEDVVEESVVDEVVRKPATKATVGIVVDCTKLNVRKKPSMTAGPVCQVNVGSELTIDENRSTDEWYRVRTADGIEGYCMKKFVTVK